MYLIFIRLTLIAIFFFPLQGFSQNADSLVIRNIFTSVLENGTAYKNLEYLSNSIGPRLSGSTGAAKAVEWAKNTMEKENNGKVYLQDVMVPHWVRNDKEDFSVNVINKKTKLKICSLGGSIPTPTTGLKGKIIEVSSFDELDKLGRKNIEGKIVFFNVPMSQKHITTFTAYGEAAKYRYGGAQKAAPHGAIASITRSMTLSLDDYPHTGSMGYLDSITKIPACAISTLGAETLSSLIKSNPDTEGTLLMNCETFPDKLSHNVIAEIKGSEYPDEIIVIGGHLDAWDNGDGAHDDGAGCVQSMEILRVFKELKIQPERTIRVVLFMNEENGLNGAKKYAKEAKDKNEKHIAAIESDAGGFTPHGFSSSALDSVKVQKFNSKWKKLFEPYGLYKWGVGGGGADIDKLKDQGTLLIGLQPDSQRYFDYHHAENDTFDKINKRELNLGAAAMISLVYLLAKYGVE